MAEERVKIVPKYVDVGGDGKTQTIGVDLESNSFTDNNKEVARLKEKYGEDAIQVIEEELIDPQSDRGKTFAVPDVSNFRWKNKPPDDKISSN